MNAPLILLVITVYFALLFLVAQLTSRKVTAKSFFTGDRESPWFLVAFGMIGASLSGVTFISVPGEVGGSYFNYFQLVLGYVPGYLVIATVLMPMYYKYNLVSIYAYLDQRFGFWSYKTGAFFFILSRTLGSSLRVFLVANVLQLVLFDYWGVPFWVSVAITVLLIWVYTFRGGIKTVVWTDSLQTFFMLASVGVSIYLISDELGIHSPAALISTVGESELSTIFNWDWQSGKNFFKQFFSGAFIAIVMTGLDQDMMQKNLTCRNIGEAQKNMFWFTIILVIVNLLFLTLGALLYIYAEAKGIAIPARTDDLYPMLATQYFPALAAIVFILGITAAAYSSADSTLTALTTSFCFDFLDIEKRYPEERQQSVRMRVHVMFTAIMFVVILLFRWLNDQSVINSVFTVASYTYGPLLGLYAFGLFTKWQINDRWTPLVAILAPSIAFALSTYSQELLFGYKFGFEILIVNGLFTFLGLMLIRKKSNA
ncbi:sodium:solute symporter [Penaeicola halotolerans]|uniref:sodium:solute symporter n=1 Tax=Penaeicola halotolerans TaxID=2793196 RepID=UPI001CF846FA|nr:sodium:solute symporter [Penaeicola halotolerans]